MAFQAKRLRVQLPCGAASAFEELERAVPAECPPPSCPEHSVPPVKIPVCGPATEPPGLDLDLDLVTVSPEGLRMLRRDLEARLALVADAERAVAAVRDRQGGV